MDYIKDSSKYIMTTYGRIPVMFEKGSGVSLTDQSGKQYLDFVAGLAVVNLGHCHPAISAAIKTQCEKLMHTSNFYHIGPQIELAKMLVENCFADKAFFCNSGAEANEAALKLARKWSKDQGKGGFEVITTFNSFHGRTLYTLSATGQEKFHAGFHPLVDGFRYVPFSDLATMDKAISDNTCAVMVEPIQGEGGINIPDENYLPGLRKMCDERGVLLIFDEVQAGMGRTGHLFAHQGMNTEPHIMTLAKALGNGLPIGACLAIDEVAASFTPGTHASTFGGNHLCCAAAVAVVETMTGTDILEHCRKVGAYALDKLAGFKAAHACVTEVRGRGLMLAMELDRPGKPVVDYCLENGMIINCTADRILRFLPPLVVTEAEVDKLIKVLENALGELD